ncbi:Uncharacterised protein [Mycobacteroides abscessus subsp. abscessus]|uniref:hypothetical protein n=1 Tax=Mycobacteroides abscessus TaxID=36809 RepID=UPI000929CA97|nr:hypothetical protein [Mycobacteroides abscessus]SIJ27762.1 Uncharacterised protein [Mycobacteroides abscessus subsp. abscessus]SKF60126.1 Uncharacterised protein [Mycobacteroides abscessus subsp. abscessus]
MAITSLAPQVRVLPELFDPALELVTASGAAELIDEYAARCRSVYSSGSTPRYTMLAALVAVATLLGQGMTPGLKRTLHRIYEFDDEQRQRLGLCADPEKLWLSDVRTSRAEYDRFYRWLMARLKYVDSTQDLPARRITNGEFHKRVAARTTAQAEAARQARQWMLTVANAIIAASVHDRWPVGYQGDLMIDETIFDVASVASGMGAKSHKQRAAAPAAGIYVRSGGVVVDTPGAQIRGIRKSAFGDGVTSCGRLGPPGARRTVAPVITAITFDRPSSGSVSAVAEVLDWHQHNGFARARTPRQRWPLLLVDMGYTNKRGFAATALERGYHPMGRYPANWHLRSQAHTSPVRGQPDLAGPILDHGSAYCPAAEALLAGRLIHRFSDFDTAAKVRAHDNRLRALLPYLMGTNSGIVKRRARRGRPTTDDYVWAQELVCPAVQGRIRCPLKPASLDVDPTRAPTASPTWQADHYRCCKNSSVMVTYTDSQLRRVQFGPVPGSWKFTFHLEDGRSANERSFQAIKSDHLTRLQHLKWGPRREPWNHLVIALAYAITNRTVQTWTTPPADSWSQKAMDLARILRHPPMLEPPRT